MPQQTELVWARYDKTTSKHYLLLYLYEAGGSTIALIADRVPDSEVLTLRTNLPRIRTMNENEINKFIKENIPISYKQGFRRFDTNKLSIEKTFGLQTFTPKPSGANA